MLIILPAATGDQNPVNSGVCPTHGNYRGLICTRRVTTLPSAAPATGAGS